MEKIRFGKTGLMVSKIAFGGIPIQRLGMQEAADVVRGVISLGVNFIDTAHGYTDSEEKIGLAIKGLPRESLILTTKSPARDKKTFLEHVDLSLKRLGVDYIDIYQLHGVSSRATGDAVFAEGGAYEGLLEAIRAGEVGYAGFSSHSIPLSMEIMRDSRYDFALVQLPFNYVDDEAEKEAIPLAKELDIGFVAMKPFGGGLLSDARLSVKYLMQFADIVPDPGIEKLSEMEEIVRIVNAGGGFSEADAQEIEQVRRELSGKWCHRCDYCLPCPQGINISNVLVCEGFIKRMPFARAKTIAGASIEGARNCTGCRECVGRCPYDIDIPSLMKEKTAIWDKHAAEN